MDSHSQSPLLLLWYVLLISMSPLFLLLVLLSCYQLDANNDSPLLQFDYTDAAAQNLGILSNDSIYPPVILRDNDMYLPYNPFQDQPHTLTIIS